MRTAFFRLAVLLCLIIILINNVSPSRASPVPSLNVNATSKIAIVFENMPDRISEKTLAKGLMNGYMKHGRPTVLTNESVKIHFNLRLTSIVDVRHESQVTIFCWMSQGWSDPWLAWNPKAYTAVKEIIFPISDIWSPDTAILNGWITNEIESNVALSKVVIDFTGYVLWVTPKTFRVVCDRVNESNYPFDILKCHFRLGSWTVTASEIDYLFSGGENDFSMPDFAEHPKWEVIRHWAAKNRIVYPCCPGAYVDLTYHLWLKRRDVTEIINASIFPFILLGFLVAVPFIMPPNSTARVQTACMTFFIIFFHGIVVRLWTASFPKPITSIFRLELMNAAIAIWLCGWLCDIRYNRRAPPSWVSKWFNAWALVLLCRCCCFCRNKSGRSDTGNNPNNSNNNNVNINTSVYSTSSKRTASRRDHHRASSVQRGESFALTAVSDCASSAEAERDRLTAKDWQTISDVAGIVAAIAFVASHLAILIVNFPRPSATD